jgi:hypothetical protein
MVSSVELIGTIDYPTVARCRINLCRYNRVDCLHAHVHQYVHKRIHTRRLTETLDSDLKRNVALNLLSILRISAKYLNFKALKFEVQ